MLPVETFVRGRPAPQGSKRHVGRGILVESSKSVKSWRGDIREELEKVWGDSPPHDGPVLVNLLFVMPRPASTPKSWTPSAKRRPDIDKLVRAVLDAVSSAGVWADDSRVTVLVASKRIAEAGEVTGVGISIFELNDRSPARST